MEPELTTEEARTETANSIGACLTRLSKASVFLTLKQRYELAEIARTLADAWDEGKVITVDENHPKRRFIKTHYCDATGATLFKEIT